MAVGAAYPRGFAAAGVTAGIKASGRPDIALVAAEAAVPAAAVFTRSRTAAPPGAVSRLAIADGRARAVLVQSGNANAATGAQGLRDAERMAGLAAQALGAEAGDVLVASTGVIGVPLPMDLVEPGIAAAAAALSPDGGADAATAIMTTDNAPKTAQRDAGGARVGGMAKGAGMIRPDLGTMIAVVTTDAALAPEAADRILRDAVDRSFNRITVDGCASTSDMVALLASGTAGPADAAAVADAVGAVCEDLALQIVRDGEGARRIARWTVTGAASDAEARRVAYAVAEAQLVRCALHGGDPNWGRIIAAIGASGADVDPDRIAVAIGGIPLCADGTAVPVADPVALDRAAAADTVEVAIGLGDGAGTAVVWGSDLSQAYVELNAEYTT
ncbi:MAG: bifunctional glutamate N-acetyltransferase/amino-acid acetyltransferase ArgJ [Actinomycetota bacterium]